MALDGLVAQTGSRLQPCRAAYDRRTSCVDRLVFDIPNFFPVSAFVIVVVPIKA